LKAQSAEGASKEETVAEAFEALHGQPEKRLQLLKKIKTAFERAREAHRVAEARVVAQAPPQEDATAEIEQLRRQRDSRARRPRCRGASRSWQSSQNVADRYAERILAETDVVKRRALERESKAVVAERRKASRSNSPNAARGSGATSKHDKRTEIVIVSLAA
jgi:hypothetical protein